jgi:hypothetical protein
MLYEMDVARTALVNLSLNRVTVNFASLSLLLLRGEKREECELMMSTKKY